MFFFSLGAFAQQLTVKGIVKDVSGEPIIGASVVVKGTSNGVITDFDGNFTIPKVPEGSVVDISFIGYVTQSVKASPQMNIILKEDSKTLDEVVVIGYGVQKKSVVTASIAKVGENELAQTAPTRVDNALKGLAAGVQVTTQNGQPGSSSVVRVRGTGTINNSDPLYIVDGMPIGGGIDNINPADIASIEVLKDAASAAVYGARAANGVVLVTTKKGALGKVKVNYDFSFGWQSPWKQREMLNATQYATLMNEAAVYNGSEPKFSDPSSLGVGTNWQDALFNDGAPVQNHQLSISGASEKINYYFSAGYYNQKGIVGGNYDHSNYERLSFRSNTQYKVFDESKTRNWLRSLTVGVNLSYSRINSRGINAGNLTGSALADALFMDPTMDVYADSEDELRAIAGSNYNPDENGEFIRDKVSGKLLNLPSPDFNELANPLARLSLPVQKNNSDKVIANLTAELGIWDNLKYKFSWGSDLAFWGNDSYSIPYYLNRNAKNNQSNVSSQMNRGYTWQIENVLTYDKTFGQHSFSVVLGQSAQRYTSRQLGGTAYDLLAYLEDKANIDFTTGLASDGKETVYGGAGDPNSLASYFGRLSYNFAERYMFQFTVRRDGSSRFGPNNKWATFPSVSVGWNITNEPWLQKRPEWWTSTKFRLSWGKNGNENIGNFRYTANVALNNNYVFGGYGKGQSLVLGSKPSGTPNADLKWEESEQYDVGLDFGFFNNALTFTVDYFYKKTNGMLKEMAIPSYLGESKPWGNVGSMKNEGVEFELGYKLVKNDWSFSVQANLSYLKNELIDLGNADGYETMDNVHQIGNISRAENGQPYPFFWGYKTDGIFQNQAEIDVYTKDGKLIQPNAVPGDVRFVDLDGNGSIDDKDKTNIGKGTPDWTFGLNFNFAYKNIDFSMLVSGQWGNQIADVTRRLDCQWVNLPAEFMDRWHGEGTSNTMPRFCWNGDDANKNWGNFSDLYIKNGAFARIKNIQIGYTLPKSLTHKFFVERLRFYVAAENLLTLTGYKGFDPELNNDKSNGIDRGYYPQARTFTVGLNLNF
ncbi:TonB-dependent receptor [Bacteroides sp. ET225]|uniref:SusC/RagA family TonB-linked outer membrane protein n=1 Tax=Bacteroides sp. ET225 TaxID=2972461 RepID=UPI0021AD3BCF|nr:TonB-dependent receptor [Bacteroides sp. ET225]MCR8917827.1 TonB-dependent receptor [Bacteroides sp. ET225]